MSTVYKCDLCGAVEEVIDMYKIIKFEDMVFKGHICPSCLNKVSIAGVLGANKTEESE